MRYGIDTFITLCKSTHQKFMGYFWAKQKKEKLTFGD